MFLIFKKKQKNIFQYSIYLNYYFKNELNFTLILVKLLLKIFPIGNK